MADFAMLRIVEGGGRLPIIYFLVFKFIARIWGDGCSKVI